MCYCSATATPGMLLKMLERKRKQKCNPYMPSPRITLGKKLPSAHQAWTTSISPRQLQVHNIPANWDAGMNSLAFPAPAEDGSVHCAQRKVAHGGSVTTVSPPEHARPRTSECQVDSHATVQAACSVGSVQRRAARQSCRKTTERRQSRMYT